MPVLNPMKANALGSEVEQSSTITCTTGTTTYTTVATLRLRDKPAYINFYGYSGGSAELTNPLSVNATDSSGRAIKSVSVTFYDDDYRSHTGTLVPGKTYYVRTHVGCNYGASVDIEGTSFSDMRGPGVDTVLEFTGVNYYSDSTPPTITAPDQKITLQQAQTWKPMDGVSARDNQDGDLTSKVTFTPSKPSAMTTTPGQYKFTYTVKDRTGNTAKKTRTITVIENTYNLSFNLNGAPGTAPTTQSLKSSQNTTEPTTPTWAGHVFEGWYTAADGGEKFQFGKPLTGDLVLYAHWGIAATAMPQTGVEDSVVPGLSIVTALSGMVLLIKRRLA